MSDEQITRSYATRATILVLCSDTTLLEVFRETLEHANYLVVTATELAGALKRIQETPPDLLIVRPYLEEMSGNEAAANIRSKMHGLPVLIATGYLDDERIRDRASLAFYDVFPAPYTAAAFVAKVNEVVSRAGKSS